LEVEESASSSILIAELPFQSTLEVEYILPVITGTIASTWKLGGTLRLAAGKVKAPRARRMPKRAFKVSALQVHRQQKVKLCDRSQSSAPVFGSRQVAGWRL